MSDTLASIRRANRAAQAASRRALRHKMNRYNPLSNVKRATESDYNTESAKTTNDVVAETLAIAKQKQGGGRFSVLSDATDKLLRECNVISPDVREVWQAKIGMHSMLTDDIRCKLASMPHSNLRETRLNDLARWMVWMWCDYEGYDPEKHPK